jgi:hypothetical protein
MVQLGLDIFALERIPFHSTHAHSAEADAATASRQKSTVTAIHGERLVISAPLRVGFRESIAAIIAPASSA